MSKIQVLDKHLAELIAAGEVVERPSSVVKELMENAIDAGASSIQVEIQRGGTALIRVTDNGCGIAREDVPTAFLRHATSKVCTADDLSAIGTLGFRGEALASIAAVARVELHTCTRDETAGTCYRIEAGEELGCEDIGCPVGTTILVRDLFYTVPARMKFLKKDVSEGNAVAGVVDRLALSHPEVSVRFVRDGREELLTAGDGDPYACIYAVFGREFADGLMPVDYTLAGVHVYGYVNKPEHSRSNRTMQHFFINGRYVKTRTAMAALEQAFKGSLMAGRFPTCVLHINLPPETVDANVHPAKIEVRFVNEKPVFDAVYHAVKSALVGHTERKQAVLHRPAEQKPTPEQIRWSLAVHETASVAEQKPAPNQRGTGAGMRKSEKAKNFIEKLDEPFLYVPPITGGQDRPLGGGAVRDNTGREPVRVYRPNIDITRELDEELPATTEKENSFTDTEEHGARDAAQAGRPDGAKASADAETMGDGKISEQVSVSGEPTDPATALGGEPERTVTYLGEAMHTYILAEMGGSLFLIDKHAAHERLLYEQLRHTPHTEAQQLLSPVCVSLSSEEYDAVLCAEETLREAGFEVEAFGRQEVLVRAVPLLLAGEDVAALLREVAGGFASGRRDIRSDKLDWLYHTTACRAAIKAGNISRPVELQKLAERVLLQDDIRTCPHGRPVCIELTKREIEKQFGRV